MRNPLHSSISRRSILKAGALSAALLALPAWSAKVIAQTTSAVAANVGSPKPNGLISFNAGWMIPVEDQKALLALEEKKNKEAQAAAPQATQSTEASVDAAKPAKKTWSEKLQDSWKQVKSYF